MDFEDFIEDSSLKDSDKEEIEERVEKIGPNQVYDVITSRKPDWQTIIYDLIASEQLDPWDIDIVVLTRKYFEKIAELEERASEEGVDFYVSSKVLLAASLLLRIKSEFLLNRYIKSIDDVLFGKKDDKKPAFERIEINDDELPLLIPKTPLPRARRITLNELMVALNKAINTESRRIGREVAVKRAKKLSEVDFPIFTRIDLKDRIRQFYARILTSLKKIAVNEEKHMNKIGYSSLVGSQREEKVSCFLPVLHLSNTKKLWLEQEEHLDEIWIYLYEYFDKKRDLFKDEFLEEFEEKLEQIEERLEDLEEGNEKDPLEKAREKLNEKRKLEEEARRELEKELGWDLSSVENNISEEIDKIEKQEKIDKISGFNEEEL